MEDISRTKLNEEFVRICDKAKEIEPGSNEYETLISELCDLAKIQNADDEIIAKREAEIYNRGAESEKLELERKKLILEEEKNDHIAENDIEKMSFEKEKVEYEKDREYEKNELERKKLNFEEKKLERELKRRKIENYVAIGVALISAISSIAIAVYKGEKNSEWQEKSFDFESNYAYTSKGSKLFDFAR